MHDEAGNWDEEGQGAGMLSFRSQMKLIPEDLSNVASEGKLGKRHPDSISKTNGVEQVKCNPIKEAREHYKRKVFFFLSETTL